MLIAFWISALVLRLQGGSVIRLFHKELEAFVVAEGLFEDEVTEDGVQNNFSCSDLIGFDS